MRTVSRYLSILGILLFALRGAGTPSVQSASPPKKTIMVPMRDGVKLATDVYLPAGTGKYPVILMRSPYNKDGAAGVGQDAQRRGYVCVVQDTRGRFASEGENLPYEGDGWAKHWDGYDTLEWIAAQPWCDGKIGTYGGSALGITQLDLAGTGTTRLSAQHIQVGAPNGFGHMVYRGGVFRKSMIEDWLTTSKHSPDSLKMWTDHSTLDAYWRDRDLTTRWEKVNTPAVHIGGWYDIFTQGTIDSFVGYQTKGGTGARGKQKLVIGPWTHGIFQDKAGELTFPNAKLPPNQVYDPWRWFDHYLKGIDNGIDRLPAVTYYVMGDVTDSTAPGNEWRTSDQWPPVTTTATPFYLSADHSVSSSKPTGREAAGSLTYAYDPKDPVPTVGGPMLTLPGGAIDQRKIESRSDVLSFTTAPLSAPMEVTGPVTMRLWASSDAPDTDFVVKLCDVYPDGRSMNMCEGILRARFRKSFQKETLMKPGEIYPFDIDLWATSVVFNKGHRLRVDVMSSSAPGYDRNPNTGARFRTSEETRVARNTIYMDARHPSHILLPVATGHDKVTR